MLETRISAPHVSWLQRARYMYASTSCRQVSLSRKSPKKRSNQMAVSSGVKRACMYQHASGLQASCQVDLNQAKLNSMLVKIYVAMCYYLCSWFYLSPSIYICAFTTIVMYISVHIKILGISPFYPTKLVKESGLPPWTTMPKMHSPSTTETRQITPLAGFHGGFADVAMMWWRPHISILPLSSLLSYSG